MDDPSESLRQHYSAQALSEASVKRILIAGQRARNRRRVRWLAVAAAAAMAMGAFAYSYRNYFSRVDASQVEGAVEAFFAQPDYQLDRMSADREALRSWLVAQGAPAQCEIPPGLARLSSVGCERLQVGRRRVFILCFKAEVMGADVAAPGVPSGSPMLKKTKSFALVHLVIADSDSIRGAKTQSEAQVDRHGEWTYVRSSKSGVSYFVASTLNPEQLQDILRQS